MMKITSLGQAGRVAEDGSNQLFVTQCCMHLLLIPLQHHFVESWFLLAHNTQNASRLHQIHSASKLCLIECKYVPLRAHPSIHLMQASHADVFVALISQH